MKENTMKFKVTKSVKSSPNNLVGEINLSMD